MAVTQIGKALNQLELEKVQEPTKQLKVSGRIFKPGDYDSRMMELKYAEFPVSTYDDYHRKLWAKSLLIKMYVITGWTLPTGEIFNILVDQFSKKLAEDYYMLNVEEIEYAFRRRGTNQEDWGKELNLNLVDKILTRYVSDRNILSDQEAHSVPPDEQVLYTDQQLDDFNRLDAENLFQQMRKGRVPYGIPAGVVEILKKDGLLKEKEDISAFFVRRLGSGLLHIYEPVS